MKKILICMISLFSLGIILGSILYSIYGIVFLIQDYDISNSCSGSNLWAYVLTAVIISLFRVNPKNVEMNKDLIKYSLFFLGLIESCLAVWGAYELWTKSCDNLIDSNIWKFAYLTFIIQLIISVLILVILPIISYTDYLDEENDIESESKIIYNDNQNTKDYLNNL